MTSERKTFSPLTTATAGSAADDAICALVLDAAPNATAAQTSAPAMKRAGTMAIPFDGRLAQMAFAGTLDKLAGSRAPRQRGQHPFPFVLSRPAAQRRAISKGERRFLESFRT
jgi:hypothetical protein